MNSNDMEIKILLAESGELSEREARELEMAMDTDASARKFRADLRRLSGDAQRFLEAEGPGEPVMIRIRRQALTVAARPLLFRHPAFPALACAAALLVVVSGWLLFQRSQPALSPVDQVQTLMAMVMEEEFVDAHEAMNREAELKELAQKLLLMEGLQIEESSTDLETEFWELPPTVLRERNTRASQAA